jgi:phosphoglycolate phosphatase-like HAD superfamily hydrolase
MLPENRAMVFDLDDTLLKRSFIERNMTLLVERTRPYQLPLFTRKEIALLDINHSPINQPFTNLIEQVAFKLLSERKIFPGATDTIKRLTDQGFDIYINTGRPNKSVWADMTNETLNNSGIKDYFKQIFYTPEGIDTAVSKAHTISLLSQLYGADIEFSDDDIRAAHFVALTFPEIQVNLIQYKLSRRINLEQFPNIKPSPTIIIR